MKRNSGNVNSSGTQKETKSILLVRPRYMRSHWYAELSIEVKRLYFFSLLFNTDIVIVTHV